MRDIFDEEIHQAHITDFNAPDKYFEAIVPQPNHARQAAIRQQKNQAETQCRAALDLARAELATAITDYNVCTENLRRATYTRNETTDRVRYLLEQLSEISAL